MAYTDWQDHDDHDDGGYVDHHDHSDSDCDYTDWADHDDAVHGDWTDHNDGAAHTDWTDHTDEGHTDWDDSFEHDDGYYIDWSDHGDAGTAHTDWTDTHTDWTDGAHQDWTNAHTDWTDLISHEDGVYVDWLDHNDWTDGYQDWTDYTDAGDPHGDWTDVYVDYPDHGDEAHQDWSNHSNSGHTDWSDHSDGGVDEGKTHVSAWIDGKDVSCYIIGADIWRDALNGIGRWELILDNQGHWWGGAFAVDDGVTIHINGSLMMMGYVDDVSPYLDSKGEYTELIKVSGRDYGMDLAQLFITQDYGVNPATAAQWLADDIVEDAITVQAGSEITYVSPSAAPSTDYEFDRTYLADGVRDLAKLVDYDYYVQDDVNRTLHFFDIATMGGGVEHTAVNLTSVAGAATNNILRLEIGEGIGFEVKNYIEAHAGDLSDHYTDLNAADWAAGAGGAVTDDTVFEVAGKGAIRLTATAPGANLYMDLTFPRYNHTSLDMYEPNVGRYAAFPNYAAALNYPIRIRLRDTGANWIEYYSITTPLTGQPPQHETTDNLRNAEWRYIEFAYGSGTEIRAGLPLVHRTWRFIGAAVAFDWSQVDRIRFHAAPLLARANGDYVIIDELRIPAVEVTSIQQDSGVGSSQALYGIRMKPFYRPDIKSQVELDAFATEQLAKFKDPAEVVKITAIGQVDSNYAAQSLDVQAPSSGIAALTPYRIFTLHHSVKLSPLENEIVGYDYITEYELVKSAINGTDQPIDPTRIATTYSPTQSMMRAIREAQRATKTIRVVRA